MTDQVWVTWFEWTLVIKGFEVDDYECELKIQKFKIVDPIWRARSVKSAKFNTVYAMLKNIVTKYNVNFPLHNFLY